MLTSRALGRPLAAAWAGGASVGGPAWAALPSLRPLSSAAAGTPPAAEDELHHQEDVADEEAEEWALGQREHHEHEGFEALPWPPPPAGDAPCTSGNCGGSAQRNSSPHNGTNSTRPVRFYSGQASGGGGARGAAGGGGSTAGGKGEGEKPPWEHAEMLWEAEPPQPGSWRQGGEEKDPFQGEEVNPHSEDRMSPAVREKMLADEATRLADESGP